MLKQLGPKNVKMPLELQRLRPALFKAAPLLSDFCRVPNLAILDCSATITGTHKDFRSVNLLRQFGSMNPIFYSITMGNAGYSLGRISRIYNDSTGMDVAVVNVIDAGLNKSRRSALAGVSTVIQADLRNRVLKQEELLDLAREKCGAGRIFVYAERGHYVYRDLVSPVLGSGADFVFLPLGTGELLDSFIKGAAVSQAAGLKTPKIFAVTIKENIFAALSPGQCSELMPSCLNGAPLADKLRSPTSLFFDDISRQASGLGISFVIVGDPAISESTDLANRSGIKSEPSAAAAFAGLRLIRESGEVAQEAKIVVVNTGYGLA